MSRALSSPLPRFKEHTERRGGQNSKANRRSKGVSNTKSCACHGQCLLNLAAAVPVSHHGSHSSLSVYMQLMLLGEEETFSLVI